LKDIIVSALVLKLKPLVVVNRFAMAEITSNFNFLIEGASINGVLGMLLFDIMVRILKM
jgi:hypothetical protein